MILGNHVACRALTACHHSTPSIGKSDHQDGLPTVASLGAAEHGENGTERLCAIPVRRPRPIRAVPAFVTTSRAGLLDGSCASPRPLLPLRALLPMRPLWPLRPPVPRLSPSPKPGLASPGSAPSADYWSPGWPATAVRPISRL